MGDLMRLLHRFAELSSAESINTVAVTQTKVSPCNFAFGLTYMGGFELISSVNAQVGQCVTCRGRAVFTFSHRWRMLRVLLLLLFHFL